MSDAAADLKELFRSSDDLLEVALHSTDDQMKLFIEATLVDPKRASEVSEQTLRAIIATKYPELKLNDRVIADVAALLNKREPAPRRRLAKGTEPIPGKDGKTVLLVKPHTGFGHRDTKDIVDARFFRHFDNIEPGTPVMRVYPPKPGTDGVDVFGKKVPAQNGSDAAAKHDDTLELKSASGKEPFETLVALTAGYLAQEGDTWKIHDELKIDGDLDLQVGDLDFVGSVIVKGNVGKGFTIRARKDISVLGSVFAANLITEEGSISVEGDVSGGKSDAVVATSAASSGMLLGLDDIAGPAIRSASQFKAKTVHQANIFSRMTITIEKELRDSVVRTSGSVVLERGHLFGGDCYAVCGVEAKIIGTDGGAKTEIHLCSNVESSGEYAELTRVINSHEHAAQMLRLHLGPYVKADEAERSTLGVDHALRVELMQRKLASVEKSYKGLLQKRQDLLKDAKFNSVMRVNFHSKLYAGTLVTAGDHQFIAKETIAGPKSLEFNSSSEEFSVQEQSALECDFEEETEN